MSRVLTATRFLVIFPILGLAVAASFFFIFGGYGLIELLVELLLGIFHLAGQQPAEVEKGLIIFEVVEYVHTFLVGTVLYITAIGLYQLFIHEIKFPDWLQIDSTEELETNLIGVTVVVLAVNFMGAVFVGNRENFLDFGAGIGIVIASLALFLGLRAYSTKIAKEASLIETQHKSLNIEKESEPAQEGE